MVRVDTCPNPVSCSTSGYRKTGSTVVMICFFKAPFMAIYFWNSAWFFRTFQFQVLGLGHFPWYAGNRLSCAAEQTQNLSVLHNLCLPLSAQGVRSGLFWVSTPRTSYYHWPIGVARWFLLLYVTFQSLEGYVSRIPWGLPCRWLLPLPWCFALLLGLTTGFSHGTTSLIC